MNERRSGKDRRSGVQRFTPGVAIVFALAVAGGTVALFLGQHSVELNAHRLDVQQHVIAEAQRGSCERVNRLRYNDNRNAATSYDLLRLVEKLTMGPDAVQLQRLRTALADVDPRTRKAIYALSQPLPGLSEKFDRLARAIRVVPSTDCTQAVGTPEIFTAPTAIPLYKLTTKEREQLRRNGVIPPR